MARREAHHVAVKVSPSAHNDDVTSLMMTDLPKLARNASPCDGMRCA